jgi:hypothetical protein
VGVLMTVPQGCCIGAARAVVVRKRERDVSVEKRIVLAEFVESVGRMGDDV